MKIISWNCQGLGNLCAVIALSHIVRVQAPKVLFLMETKRSMTKMKQITDDLPDHGVFVVPSVGRSGIGNGLEGGSQLAHSNIHLESY